MLRVYKNYKINPSKIGIKWIVNKSFKINPSKIGIKCIVYKIYKISPSKIGTVYNEKIHFYKQDPEKEFE